MKPELPPLPPKSDEVMRQEVVVFNLDTSKSKNARLTYVKIGRVAACNITILGGEGTPAF
jgi:hypothetical protein